MKQKIKLKGLSWGHRRASGPLPFLSAAFSSLDPGIKIEWHDRNLAGFESQPIIETAQNFDLIIYDHPFSGDIVEANAFMRLDLMLPDLLGPDADRFYVGPSLASYRYDGGVWGAPIDAATEHAVYRADLLATAGEDVPRSWPDVVALGARLQRQGLYLGAPIVSPHAILAVAALCSNAGVPWPTDPDLPFRIDANALTVAIERLSEVIAFCPADVLTWNAIDLHEAMVARDDIVYAPCSYGYATYGEPDMRRRLSFADFPGISANDPSGTAIGGTALAISTRTQHPEQALSFVAFTLSELAQRHIIAAHHGQPALLSAWQDAGIDRRFNGFYSGITRSMQTSWIRPRFKRYIPFQHHAGDILVQLFRRDITMTAAVSAILDASKSVGSDA